MPAARRPEPAGTGAGLAPVRRRAPERTRLDILDAATAEFSEKGFAGGRVDDIAARTRTTKRMIYYYFGGKRQLYAAVLERAYGGMRDAEAALDIADLPPIEAIRRIVEVTFDHEYRCACDGSTEMATVSTCPRTVAFAPT